MSTGSSTRHIKPFISLARILLACAITPIEALLRFPLVAEAYDTTLGGLAPFLDLWVPLQLAREVVLELGRLDELEALLDWDSRRAWTVEDREEEALLHNWRIPTECLSPADYSTKTMLATTFDRMVLLPPTNQVRTLLPPPEEIPSYGQSNGTTDMEAGSDYDQLWSKVVEWSVVEYERWNHRDHLGNDSNPVTGSHSDPGLGRYADSDGDTDETSSSSDLTPLFLYTTLTHLLQLETLIPLVSSDQTPPDTLAHLPSIPPLHRAALLHISSSPSLSSLSVNSSSSTTAARLYLLDAITRLVAHHYRQHALESLAAVRTRHRIREALLVAEQVKFGDLQARLDQVEARLEEDANRQRERASRDRLIRERVKALEEEVDRLALGAPRNAANVGSLVTHFGGGGVDTRSAVMMVAAAAFVLGVAIGIALANAAGGGGPGRV
ncbi:hypothetical protein JCM8115_004424 [Rhodotorula mucilaginosa]